MFREKKHNINTRMLYTALQCHDLNTILRDRETQSSEKKVHTVYEAQDMTKRGKKQNVFCRTAACGVVSGPHGGRIEGNTHAQTQTLNHTLPLNKFIYVQLS